MTEVSILMPRMDPDMEEGRIVEWLKKEGEHVEKGEVVVQAESEKVLFDIVAPESGTLKKIVASAGDVVPIVQPIAVIQVETSVGFD